MKKAKTVIRRSSSWQVRLRIPKAIREKLSIKDGDFLNLTRNSTTGTVYLDKSHKGVHIHRGLVYLPKAVSERGWLREDSEVTVEESNGRILINPVRVLANA